MQTIEFPIDDSDEDFLYGNLIGSNSTNTPSDEDLDINKYRIDAANVSCDTSEDNFCESIHLNAYPNNHIKSLLERSPIRSSAYERKTPNVTIQKNGCIHTSEMIYPVIAFTTQGEWRFIINVAEFLQPIRMDKCVQRQNQCLNNDLTFDGNVTYCKQDYKVVQLYSLNDNGDMKLFEYNFPSICRCRA